MTKDLSAEIDALDWSGVYAAIDDQGFAVLPNLLRSESCQALSTAYTDDALFRNRVIMEKHAYGRGEYRYFAYPLPDVVQTLRHSLYRHLALKANDWMVKLKRAIVFPPDLAAFLERCHAAGQSRPTPLLLRYAAGDYNCLHRDLYGAEVFPLQVAILLSAPEADFSGGEFIMTEQRPRMQSRVRVVPLTQGDAVIFAVADRPLAAEKRVQGHSRASSSARANALGRKVPRFYRVQHRHGVATLRSGNRITLGIIFHDAE